jgi:hypothetical protein
MQSEEQNQTLRKRHMAHLQNQPRFQKYVPSCQILSVSFWYQFPLSSLRQDLTTNRHHQVLMGSIVRTTTIHAI